MKPGNMEAWLEFRDRAELTDADVVVQVTAPHPQLRCEPAAARALEQAFETCYAALAGRPLARFETLRVIDEIARGRTTIWMRVTLGSRGDDDAGDAPDPLLTFLARGTLTILGWLNTPAPRLDDLRRAIRTLADGTLPPSLTRTLAPTSSNLVKAAAALEQAGAGFGDADSVRIIMHRGSTELETERALPDVQSLLVEKTILSPASEMILIVEQPDYENSGQWLVRHGAERVSASCEPAIGERFARRELDIRPHDAIRCRAQVERSYDADNELVGERVRIVEILKVIPRREAEPQEPAEEQPPAEEPVEQFPERSSIVEHLEGEFGSLTLRRIPLD